jgi:hypothetical protein
MSRCVCRHKASYCCEMEVILGRWSVVTFEYPCGRTGVRSTGQPLALPRRRDATSRQRLTPASREQHKPHTQLFTFLHCLYRINQPFATPIPLRNPTYSFDPDPPKAIMDEDKAKAEKLAAAKKRVSSVAPMSPAHCARNVANAPLPHLRSNK